MIGFFKKERMRTVSAVILLMFAFSIMSSTCIVKADTNPVSEIQEVQEVQKYLGFEEVANNFPAGWEMNNASWAKTAESSTEKVFSGNYSIKNTISSVAGQNQPVGVESSKFKVDVGQLYNTSAYVYSIDTKAGESQLYLKFYDKANAEITTSSAFAKNTTLNAWNRLEANAIAPSNAVYGRIVLYSGNTIAAGKTGYTYFDDVSLSKVTEEIKNSNMEESVNNFPSSWDLINLGWALKDKISIATDIKSSGNQSVRFELGAKTATANVPAGKVAGIVSAPFKLQPGERYKVSANAYSTNSDFGSTQLYVRFYDMTGAQKYQFFSKNTASNQWNKIIVDFTVPADAVFARVLLYNGTVPVGAAATNAGAAYFDDVALEHVIPTPIKDYQLLVPGHPRLYYTANDIDALKAKTNDTAKNYLGTSGQEIWSQIKTAADKYLAETSFDVLYGAGDNAKTVTYSFPALPTIPPRENPLAGFTTYPFWTEMARNYQLRMETLSLAYSITGDMAYANKAKECALAISSWTTWDDPNYSPGAGLKTNLDTAHLTYGVSMVYDTVYDLLTDAEKVKIETAVENNGLKNFVNDLSTYIDNNNTMLRASALAVGGVVLHGRCQNANRYISEAASYFVWYLNQRMKSGEQEGFQYTSYSMDYMMKAVDIICRATGDKDIISNSYINDYVVKWCIYNLAPGGAGLANFSDSSPESYFCTTMNIISNVLKNPYAGWYLYNAKPRTDSLLESFIYINSNIAAAPLDGLPKSKIFDELGWATLRSGWNKDDILLSFISNKSAAYHNHFDENSFLIAANNTWIASDPGYQVYTAGPANLLTNYYGHNTIRAGGKGQSSKGGSTLTKGVLSDFVDYIKGDAANAYVNPKLDKFTRNIVFVKPGYYVMMDDLKSPVDTTFDWTLYSNDGVKYNIDGVAEEYGQSVEGNSATIYNSDAMLTLEFLANSKLPVSIGKYPGAETYGPILTVGSGSPSKEHKFVTVIKPKAIVREGTFKASDLITGIESSGKECKKISLSGTNIAFYKSLAADDYVTFPIQVNSDGKYDVKVKFVRSTAYGMVQAYMDGNPVGTVFDAYSDKVFIDDNLFSLGEMNLTKGVHKLMFKITGKNDSSSNYYIGFDSFILNPVGTTQTDTPAEDPIAARYLEADNVVGACVKASIDDTSSDLVLFKTGTQGGFSVEKAQSDAQQSMLSVNEKDEVKRYEISEGTYLNYNNVPLISSNVPVTAALSYDSSRTMLSGIVGAQNDVTLNLTFRNDCVITLDGKELSMNEYTYNKDNAVISLALAKGEHQISIATRVAGISLNTLSATLAEGSGVQLTATVLPADATNRNVIWSVESGTDSVSVSNGLVKALRAGTAVVRVTSAADSSKYAECKVTVVIPVTDITVTEANGLTTVEENKTLQMNAAVLPVNATDKSVTWSVLPGTGNAAISTSGALTGINAGTVTVVAAANDISGIKGTATINVIALVKNMTISGANNQSSVALNKSLQMYATILPANATNKSVTWKVTNGLLGRATITSSGLLTGTRIGTVTVTATANDGSGVKASMKVAVCVPAVKIIVTGANGARTVKENCTLQMNAVVLPLLVSSKSVTWSVLPGTGNAEISASGLLKGIKAGTVTVVATANDGTGVKGSMMVKVMK